MAATIKTPPMPRAGDTTTSRRATMPEGDRVTRNVLEEGAEVGAEMLAVVRENATAFYHEQRDRAANEIGALGEMLHNSVQSMQRRDALVARFTDEAASQIDDFAAWLRTRSWGELTGDVEDLARRYPLSFLSTAVGLGFLAARLLTASTRNVPDDRMAASGGPAMAGTGGSLDHRPGAMPGEGDVIAGVSGGAAATHNAGLTGED